jgi:hypothetical protein
MIEGLACAWLTGSVGSRGSPADVGYRFGLTAPGSRPRLPGPPNAGCISRAGTARTAWDEGADRPGTNPAGGGSFKL